MNTFHVILVLKNKEYWIEYATNILKSNKDKPPEVLLTDILTFDFKFDTILQ